MTEILYIRDSSTIYKLLNKMRLWWSLHNQRLNSQRNKEGLVLRQLTAEILRKPNLKLYQYVPLDSATKPTNSSSFMVEQNSVSERKAQTPYRS